MNPRRADQYQQLRRELEAEYPDIVDECGDDGDGDVAEAERPARVMLRREDTIPSLFDYQADLAEQFEAVCSAAASANKALLTLPTGAGKTRTAAVALLRLFARDGAGAVLWLAPTRELLLQASDTLEAVWHGYKVAVDMELVRADLLGRVPDDLRCGVIFATPQMVASRSRSNSMVDPDIIVFDEAHHVEAPLFKQAVERVRARRNAAVLGLSATPGRTKEDETERLVEFFDGRLLRSKHLEPNPIAVLQRRGVLARVAFRNVAIRKATLAGRTGPSLSYLRAELDRFFAIVRVTKRLAKNARVLVFAASVDHAHLVAAVLRRERVAAKAISSYDSNNVRRITLQDFERGSLSVVVNKALLATGYDCPAIRHVVLGVPIKSAIMFEQIVGRASRGPVVGGNAKSTVWQFEDHLKMHGLPQSYYRYDDYDWRDLPRGGVR